MNEQKRRGRPPKAINAESIADSIEREPMRPEDITPEQIAEIERLLCTTANAWGIISPARIAAACYSVLSRDCVCI
jgi:hypothetical protein